MMNEKLLKQAINVLKSLNEKHFEDSSKKKPLLEDEKEITVYLQISLKKIPKLKSIQTIKINLPHSLLKDNSEVCLITGDLDKRNHKAEIEPDVLHYKELLKKHDVNCISEVFTLRQLRTEYKPYEAKQKLLAAYDVFLADRKIAECLPRVLGRHFYKKRKFPIQVTMNTPNLKQQIEKALSTKVFYLTGHGNSCNSEVAHLDMTNTEISENVMAVTKAFCDRLPGSWNNVMGIYLKTALSKAVPVYMSYDNPSEVHLDEVKNDNTFEIDELSTFPDGLVKVYKDGSVRTVRKKRMAEIDTEICDAADDSGDPENREKEEKFSANDTDGCLTNTDLNEESAKVTKKSKRKKKEESLMEQKVDKSDAADDSGDSENREKEEKYSSNDVADCLTNANSNEESAKVTKKSKRKKKEESLVEQMVDKNASAKVKRKSKSKKNDEESLFEEEADKSICSMEVKENSLQTTKKAKGQRKRNETVLMNETCDSAPNSETKGESNEIIKKSKSRKSVQNMLVKEDEIVTDNNLKVLDENSKISKRSLNSRKIERYSMIEADKEVMTSKLKEELPKVIGKSKRKREESMLSDANRSLTYSPVQAVKKKKAEQNLKKLHSVKGINKGKKKRDIICKYVN